MGKKDSISSLDSLFAEAMEAVEKIEVKTTTSPLDDSEEPEIEIEFSNTPVEGEVDIEFDVEEPEPTQIQTGTETDVEGLILEKENQIADLQQQLQKYKRGLAKRKKANQALTEAQKDTQAQLFQQRAMVQRMKERVERAEARASNIFDIAQTNQSRVESLEKALETSQKKLERSMTLRNKENKENKAFGIRPAILQFIPIFDNLERALKHSQSDFDTLLEGLRMSHQQFENALTKLKVHRVKTAYGTTFDPDFHEAIMRREVEDLPPNRIVEELSSGYTLNERLLRAARVVVSTKPQTEQSSSTEVQEIAKPEDAPESSQEQLD